jgi:hypothetical protein
MLVVTTEQGVLFVHAPESQPQKSFCEYSIVEDGRRIVSASIDYSRISTIVTVVTNLGEVISYEPKMNTNRGEVTQCSLAGKIELPLDFTLGKPFAIGGMRGALALQN